MSESILDKVLATQGQSAQFDVIWTDFLQLFFKFVSEKERSMLFMRFGIEGHPEKTLEEIGDVYHLTRERVRQIIKHGIKTMKTSIQNDEVFLNVSRRVVHELELVGGMMEHEQLVSLISKETHRRSLALFLLEEIGVEGLDPVGAGIGLKRAWKLTRIATDSFVACLRALEVVLSSGPMSESDLFEQFRTREEFRYLVSLALDPDREQELFHNVLTLSETLHGNVMGLWGVVSDPLVTPKRVGDKIYLVLKQSGHPLHFREITEAINKMKFDSKRAYLPTIHNELILDPRFVLVGRGTYALVEWGYVRGVVADVIEDLMRTRGPLTREEIEEGVLKQRMVKPGTIYLSLMNKKRFVKDKETGKYDLVSKGTETTPVLPGIGKAADPASDQNFK